MHDFATLTALQERLRSATGPDLVLDVHIWVTLVGGDPKQIIPPRVTASVDAALALVEKLGWCPHMMHFGPKGASGWTCVDLCPPNRADEGVEREGNTAPLAILSTLLAALIANGEDRP